MLLGVGGSGGLFAKSYVTLVTHGLWPARLCCPWNFPIRIIILNFLKMSYVYNVAPTDCDL